MINTHADFKILLCHIPTTFKNKMKIKCLVKQIFLKEYSIPFTRYKICVKIKGGHFFMYFSYSWVLGFSQLLLLSQAVLYYNHFLSILLVIVRTSLT